MQHPTRDGVHPTSLNILEPHGRRGSAGAGAALDLHHRPQPDGKEGRRLHGGRGAQGDPEHGRNVPERPQLALAIGDVLDSPGEPRAVDLGERGERRPGAAAVLGVADLRRGPPSCLAAPTSSRKQRHWPFCEPNLLPAGLRSTSAGVFQRSGHLPTASEHRARVCEMPVRSTLDQTRGRWTGFTDTVCDARGTCCVQPPVQGGGLRLTQQPCRRVSSQSASTCTQSAGEAPAEPATTSKR